MNLFAVQQHIKTPPPYTASSAASRGTSDRLGARRDTPIEERDEPLHCHGDEVF